VKAALLAVLWLGVGIAIGCGGGGGGPDAALDGTAIDAPSPDAMDRCQTLCACTFEFCSDEMATCVADCAALDDSVRECRIEHCGYAQTNPGFHCPHALGDPASVGVPPACIQN
jgi:hypothetical protein